MDLCGFEVVHSPLPVYLFERAFQGCLVDTYIVRSSYLGLRVPMSVYIHTKTPFSSLCFLILFCCPNPNELNEENICSQSTLG